MTWLALPFTLGPLVTDALAGRSDDVRWTVAVLLWAAWTITLVALLVPRTVSLTVLRSWRRLALAVAAWAAWAGRSLGIADVVALASAALAVGAAFWPLTGDVFIDGSSYGTERRMALRVPTTLLLGPLPLAWVAAVAGGRRPGRCCSRHISGSPARSVWSSERRWSSSPRGRCTNCLGGGSCSSRTGWSCTIPIGQPEPTLFLRKSVRRLGPAPADSHALDLTQGSFGLALQLDLVEPTDILVPRGRSTTETVTVDALLFTPIRPAALLDESARTRRITRSSGRYCWRMRRQQRPELLGRSAATAEAHAPGRRRGRGRRRRTRRSDRDRCGAARSTHRTTTLPGGEPGRSSGCTVARRGAPWALHWTSTAPDIAPSAHATGPTD